MAFEKVQGDHLFDGNKLWGREKVLVRGDQGQKIDLINWEDAGDDVLYVPGLVTPGLVNAHCHTELSHLRDVVPRGKGLVPFLLDVVGKREADEETIFECAHNAVREMEEDGIIAVGDICNTTQSITAKKGSSVEWRNFVEVLSLKEAAAPERIKHYTAVLDEFRKEGMSATLTPHAPYTVHPAAMKLINDATAEHLLSIHNQETQAENELFITGGGSFLQLYQAFGMQASPLPVSGKSSIRTYLPFFTKGQHLLLIHNTFMNEEDLDWALDHAQHTGLRLTFCFCVNANLYIEDRIPDLSLFRGKGCHIVLGTDSYSSNDELKITHEISTIRDRYPSIPLEEILRWATVNGSDALGVSSRWVTGVKIPFAD